MLNNLIDALQLVLLIFIVFTLNKEPKLNKYKYIEEEKEEEELKQKDKEIVEYIKYCPSSLSLVERFANNFVDLSHYHWCTWEHSTKGTVISVDYRQGGDEWFDLYPGNYLVFNQTHKTFSDLTPEDLLVEINNGVKNYKQWVIT